MLSCKKVAQRASDYLEANASTGLTWQVRLHLIMCSNCRRFVRHLSITKTVSASIAQPSLHTDPEPQWEKLHQRLKENPQHKPE